MCTICHTSGQSMPMLNATVAMTTRNWLGLVKALIIPSFWCWSVTLVKTSTSLNLARLGAPIGSVMLSPNSALKKRYISAQGFSVYYYSWHTNSFWLQLLNYWFEGCSKSFKFADKYIMFFLQGDLARIYGSCIPIVRVTEYRRVLVAVAVRAITFKLPGSILRTSQMRSRTARKVCPL